MVLTSDRIDELAAVLRTAEATAVPVPPVRAAVPELSIEDGYSIQNRNRAIRLEAGEHIVGHKIGLTSVAIQQQLGVDQPDYGFITNTMVVPDGGSLATAGLIAPRLEPEFAFRIGHALSADATIEDLRAAIDAVAVAGEIIDSRIANWDITLGDTIADNASSARIVLGAWRNVEPGLLESLPTTDARLLRDAGVVSEGPGSAVLGDPVVSAHWLVQALGSYGEALEAGAIVLAGAVSAAVDLTPGRAWRVEANGFGAATFSTEPEGVEA